MISWEVVKQHMCTNYQGRTKQNLQLVAISFPSLQSNLGKTALESDHNHYPLNKTKYLMDSFSLA